MVFCGIDIGTSNTKGVLLDVDGGVLDRITISSQDQTAAQWYGHFRKVLDYFTANWPSAKEKIVCSITSQGGSFVLLDGSFKPIGKTYSWTGLAEQKIVQDLVESIGKERFYHITGCDANGWLMACKLKELALKDSCFAATVPDFIHSQIAGKLVTDITNAQITGLCDFEKASWSQEVLDWTGVKAESLASIAAKLEVLFEELETDWGKLSLVTSSHD